MKRSYPDIDENDVELGCGEKCTIELRHIMKNPLLFPLREGFSALGAIDIFGRKILCCGSCSVYLASLPDFYPLDVSSTNTCPPLPKPKMSPYITNVPWEAKSSLRTISVSKERERERELPLGTRLIC